MKNILTNLKPKELWYNFEQISNIPRPSKHEQKVIEYIKNFGENLKLETIVDYNGNVIIKKPATKGMENKKTVILQAHLDMVPQKNRNKVHDFMNDPISLIIDDGWVRADETTLGADNGIGVAAIMAILESKTLKHGPIEALFTVDEETGMTGAFFLQRNSLKGDILINTDSEEEGYICIGCAGGMDSNAVFKYYKEKVPADCISYRITVTGLKGGHSGVDINKGRGNAIKILTRFLWEASKLFDLRIEFLEGGGLRNSIPREALANFIVPDIFEDQIKDFFNDFYQTIKEEYSITDPIVTLTLDKIDQISNIIDKITQKKLLDTLYACPNGVIRMDPSMPAIPETSNNLASVKMGNGIIEIECLLRSSSASAKEDLGNMVASIFELAGAEFVHSGTYPGWKPNLKSEILNVMKNVYQQKFGKSPVLKVIHAGLECGVIGDIFPHLDMISIGPTIKFAHSPDEKVNIESVERFWEFLISVLENIPDKN
jgi:dipeptidase D